MDKNVQSYRKFCSDEEISKWVFENYLDEIQSQNIRMSNGKFPIIHSYTGSCYEMYNSLLRKYDFQIIKTKKFDGITDEIIELIKYINSKSICENIVVYRYESRKVFKKRIAKYKNKLFIAQGFTSTSLSYYHIKEFSELSKVLLEIYVPIGSSGVYTKFDKGRLNEHEILLQTHCKFQYIGKYFNFKLCRFIYKCKLIESNFMEL